MIINVYNWVISPYMICMLIAFICGFIVAGTILHANGVPIRIILLSEWLNVVFIAIGGKAYTYFFSYHSSMEEIYESKLLNILGIPFSSMGGMLGMVVGIVAFNYIYNTYTKVFWKTYVLILPLMYSISKVGCHLMGCCYGYSYSGFGKISYRLVIRQHTGIYANQLYRQEALFSELLPKGELFPVQLVEVIAFAIIFMAFLGIYIKNKTYSVCCLLCICAFAKGSLEIFRAEYVKNALNTNQVFCLLVVLASLIHLLINRLWVNKEIENG